MVSRPLLIVSWLALLGCPKEDGESGEGGGTAETSGITSATTQTTTAPTSTTDSSTASTGMSASGTEATATESNDTTDSDPSATEDSSGSTTSNNDPGNPLDCGGTIYQCGDMMDNDGDGNIDLQDPECTGPCDDDEETFQTGLPGDNMDCKQDCFFDGNSGQGDDGCNWDLRCDPANPGANIGCAYTGGNNCENMPPNQTDECIMFCEQYVPPGCDCFGCCTVETDQGPVDIFLNSGPDCSLDNLDACEPCTSQIDQCGTPCVPEKCQVCFGETEPPEGCGENMCPNDLLPCDSDNPDACPTDFFCYLGCCYPPPPG